MLSFKRYGSAGCMSATLPWSRVLRMRSAYLGAPLLRRLRCRRSRTSSAYKRTRRSPVVCSGYHRWRQAASYSGVTMTFPTLSFFWQATIPLIRQNGYGEAVRFFRPQFAEGFGPRMRAPNQALPPTRAQALRARGAANRRQESFAQSAVVVAHRSIADVQTPQTCCASGWASSTTTPVGGRLPISGWVRRPRGSTSQTICRSSLGVPPSMSKNWRPSMGELRIEYVFRRPRYPLLCVVGDVLIAARTRQQLQRRLGRCVLSPNETLSVIDASGEGWALHTDCMALSPMMMMKRWTKAELIELYQQTVAGAQAETASGDDKSWLKLRVDEVVGMIVALIERVRTPNPRLQRSTAADGSALRGSTRATNRCGGR